MHGILEKGHFPGGWEGMVRDDGRDRAAWMPLPDEVAYLMSHSL